MNIKRRSCDDARSDFERLLIFFGIEPLGAAALLDVPPSTVYAWCAGKRRVPDMQRTVTELMLRFSKEESGDVQKSQKTI